MKKYISLIILSIFCLGTAHLNANNEIDPEGETFSRTEKKSFANVSEIEIDHKYGNIIVLESSSKQVDLEIQYREGNNGKASCELTNKGNILYINTRNSDQNASIDYIISIPKDVKLTVKLLYGNIKLDKYQGAFSANLSYSDLSAQSFTGYTPNITLKYGSLKIDEVKDADISGSYSDIKIKNANKIEIKGEYNSYRLDNVHTITGTSASYIDLKVGNVTNFTADFSFGDININNLISTMNSVCSYTDVKIQTTSAKLNSINIRGSYADISIGLSPDLSASFEATTFYGDIIISKALNVQYTRQEDSNNRIMKKGQIGTKTPTAKITVSNNYSDIKIK